MNALTVCGLVAAGVITLIGFTFRDNGGLQRRIEQTRWPADLSGHVPLLRLSWRLARRLLAGVYNLLLGGRFGSWQW